MAGGNACRNLREQRWTSGTLIQALVPPAPRALATPLSGGGAWRTVAVPVPQLTEAWPQIRTFIPSPSLSNFCHSFMFAEGNAAGFLPAGPTAAFPKTMVFRECPSLGVSRTSASVSQSRRSAFGQGGRWLASCLNVAAWWRADVSRYSLRRGLLSDPSLAGKRSSIVRYSGRRGSCRTTEAAPSVAVGLLHRGSGFSVSAASRPRHAGHVVVRTVWNGVLSRSRDSSRGAGGTRDQPSLNVCNWALADGLPLDASG